MEILDTRKSMIESQLNYQSEQHKCPITLYKTDYNNQSDLSRFVDEYNKAQAMIKECKEFYKSFLKSKLLTYSQLTNTIWKKDAYKFYTFKLVEYNSSIFIKDILNFFGYKEEAESYTYQTVSGNFIGIVQMTEFLAALNLVEQYKKDVTKLAYPSLHGYGMHIAPEYMKFKVSGFIYNVYGNRVNQNDTNCLMSEFPTKEQYSQYARSMYEIFEQDWNKLKKEWLPKVLKYFGTDKLCCASISYLIYDDALDIMNAAMEAELANLEGKSATTKKKKTKEIEAKYKEDFKKLNDAIKANVTVNLTDCYSYNDIINFFEHNLLHNGIGHWGYSTPDMLKINDKLNKYIKSEISYPLQVCQEMIAKYSNYDNKNLYIIKNNEAILYCTSDDIDKDRVSIQVINRKLVCTFKEESAIKYNQFAKFTNCVDLYKKIIFDIDTNEMVSYDTHEQKYKIQYDY